MHAAFCFEVLGTFLPQVLDTDKTRISASIRKPNNPTMPLQRSLGTMQLAWPNWPLGPCQWATIGAWGFEDCQGLGYQGRSPPAPAQKKSGSPEPATGMAGGGGGGGAGPPGAGAGGGGGGGGGAQGAPGTAGAMG